MLRTMPDKTVERTASKYMWTKPKKKLPPKKLLSYVTWKTLNRLRTEETHCKSNKKRCEVFVDDELYNCGEL